jgi:hypothetical protein
MARNATLVPSPEIAATTRANSERMVNTLLDGLVSKLATIGTTDSAPPPDVKLSSELPGTPDVNPPQLTWKETVRQEILALGC